MSIPDDRRPRIINITRKPHKCSDCGERLFDIVYEVELIKYNNEFFSFEAYNSADLGNVKHTDNHIYIYT